MHHSPDSELALGIDLGGTKVLTALVDPDGAVVESYRHPTGSGGGFEAVLARIVESVESCLAAAGDPTIVAAGVGVAGQVSADDGSVYFAPNLGWRDAALGTGLAEALGMPVAVLNDVRAATWGEWRYGAGREADDIVVVFVGTGIGGGVVSGGRLLEGCTNAAAELGHLTIVAEGRPCRCPNLGCFEAYAGGWGIAERAQAAVAGDPDAGRRLKELAGGDPLTAAHVTAAFRDGDPLGTQLFDDTARYLGAGLTAIVNAFNPCTLVVGGGVVERSPEYLERASATVMARSLGIATRELAVVDAALGADGGVIGAADYARTLARGKEAKR